MRGGGVVTAAQVKHTHRRGLDKEVHKEDNNFWKTTARRRRCCKNWGGMQEVYAVRFSVNLFASTSADPFEQC